MKALMGIFVFPMRVGMNRAPGKVLSDTQGLPHARGDEPAYHSIIHTDNGCSPRAWE